MATRNAAGRKVVEHEAGGRTLHLFVQPRSHKPALYIGRGRVVDARAKAPMRGPMQVEFALARRVPAAVLRELGVDEGGVVSPGAGP